MNDGKSIGPREPGDERRRGYTIKGCANQFSVSTSLIKRAVSHDVIKVIYLGDRPIIPASEVERIGREGMVVPRGYRRKSPLPAPGHGGRPRSKSKAAKAGKAAKPTISPNRRKREAERAAASD
jgi:hypothetical protein